MTRSALTSAALAGPRVWTAALLPVGSQDATREAAKRVAITCDSASFGKRKTGTLRHPTLNQESSTSLYRAASQGQGETSRPPGLGAAIRCDHRSAMTAPLMRGSRISAITTDSGNHNT